MAETRAPIDFASGQKSSSDPLGGSIPRTVNMLVDSTGAMHLRPGISAWSDFGPTPSLDASTSIDGIQAWNGYVVYVSSDRRLHAQLSPGYGIDISDGTAATQLDGGGRPVFYAARTRVVIAGAGLIQKWEGPGAGLSARLGGNPPAASHVVAISQRLVVNPLGLSGQIMWSDVGDIGNETWSGFTVPNFLELSSDPDPLTALYSNTDEIIGIGTRTVQTLDPDPTEIFLPVRTWTQGSGAPYSVAQNDETFAFLDNLKRIQLSDGRQYTPISDPAITDSLKQLTTVSDCWGFRMAIGSWDLLGFHFPTEGRTFVYDTTAKQWQEWAGFAGGNFAGWMAKSHYHWPEQDLHLIGLGDGTVAKMDVNAVTDMGQPIVAEAVSGFNDFGTDVWKQHISTRFYFRRGVGSGVAPGPQCQLFWRDGPGAWQGPESLSLGDPSDQAPVVEIRSLGIYRMRQYRLRMSDSVPLTFVRAIETFEPGEM
jgi:hypothetical protein